MTELKTDIAPTFDQPCGWKMLINASKAHFFIGGRSLCRRWATLSDNGLEDSMHHHPQNCKACVKRRDAIVKEREK